jgi:hypothetical protein
LLIESNDQLVFYCKWSEYGEEVDAFYRNGRLFKATKFSSLIPEMYLTESFSELIMILHFTFNFCMRWQIMSLKLELYQMIYNHLQQGQIMLTFHERELLPRIHRLYCFDLRVGKLNVSVDFNHPLSLEVEKCSPV